METVRAFVAIPLPAPLLDALHALQRRLERRMPPDSVRWVRAEGIHLTLKFLGDVPARQLDAIRAALAAAAREHMGFVCGVEGLGCFPNPHRPRVVWVGLHEPSGRLAALHGAVERALAELGYPPEGRPFTPHLTLGRVRDRLPAADVAAIGAAVGATPVGRLGELEAQHLDLMQSVLRPDGARYTTLASFTLQGLGGPSPV